MSIKYLHLEQALFIFLILLASCNNKKEMTNSNFTQMNKLTEGDWIKLSDKRIFFGHQSVGSNIIDGITTLKNESNSTSFVVLETKDKSDFLHPIFAHSSIGNNYDAKSKIDDFVNILQSGLADSLDVAFMKFCYVDIDRHTNINTLFEYYKTSINTLQEKYPYLKIIHYTVPLMTKPKGLKGLIKTILKMDNNVFSNKYNELMRNHYSDSELFDIAKIEATFSDGAANKYGNGIPGLIPEYTSDGGHLNQRGRLLMADELLRKLLMN